MDESVIEKYIEISIGISISTAIVYEVKIKWIVVSIYSFNTWYCSGWLIEEWVNEFVIEKYIEISIGISISTTIVYEVKIKWIVVSIYSFNTWYCSGLLIEEWVNEFVIEKYIEIIKGISIMYKFMLIQILTLLVLQYNGMNGGCSYNYSKRALPNKVKLVALARGYKKHK